MILDKLPAHKRAAARSVIVAKCAWLLFIPPHSSDFDSIKKAVSKLTVFLRKAAAHAIDELWRAIGNAIATFTPAECADYFAAARYDATERNLL